MTGVVFFDKNVQINVKETRLCPGRLLTRGFVSM